MINFWMILVVHGSSIMFNLRAKHHKTPKVQTFVFAAVRAAFASAKMAKLHSNDAFERQRIHPTI